VRIAVDDILDLRAPDPHEFNRMVAWSFVAHIVLIGVLFVLPRAWITRNRTPPTLMTISLAGSVGERTTGMTPVGGRPVERATPPPKRPEPVRPAATKRDVMTVPEKTPARPSPPKPAPTVEQPPSPITRPPTTGREVTAGSAAAETGARGQGTGLTSGGGGTGASFDASNFCCNEYITDMQRRIEQWWKRDLQERGETKLRFVIHRDGTVTDITVETPSGSGVLDRAAKAALLQASPLGRLPDRYEGDTLVVHLSFPYGIR
jgi:TonB family protein